MTDSINVRDQRQPGWYWAEHAIIDVYGPLLGPFGLAVYHVLARHADRQGKAFPSLGTIADKAGCSKRKVRDILRRLEDLDLVTVVEQNTPSGRQTSNIYYLLDVPGEGAQGAGGGGTTRQGEGAQGAALEKESVKKNKRTRTKRTFVPGGQKRFAVAEDGTRFISGKYKDEVEY